MICLFNNILYLWILYVFEIAYNIKWSINLCKCNFKYIIDLLKTQYTIYFKF